VTGAYDLAVSDCILHPFGFCYLFFGISMGRAPAGRAILTGSSLSVSVTGAFYSAVLDCILTGHYPAVQAASEQYH